MGHDYRDRVASYIDATFGRYGLVVYTEVDFGRTIIGKNRRVDIFVLRPEDQRALALECKYQASTGTTDEKIPYALQDLQALWIPGVLVYGGDGWSKGVLHTLQGSRIAVFCDPSDDLGRRRETIELDHALAAVFGLWDRVLPYRRRFKPEAQLDLPAGPFARVSSPRRRSKKTGDVGDR